MRIFRLIASLFLKQKRTSHTLALKKVLRIRILKYFVWQIIMGWESLSVRNFLLLLTFCDPIILFLRDFFKEMALPYIAINIK